MHVVGRWACINIWLIGNQRILELDIVSTNIESILKYFQQNITRIATAVPCHSFLIDLLLGLFFSSSSVTYLWGQAGLVVFSEWACLCHHCLLPKVLVGEVMFPHHSDKFVSEDTLWGCFLIESVFVFSHFRRVILTQGDVLLKSWCRTFLFKYFSEGENPHKKEKH